MPEPCTTKSHIYIEGIYRFYVRSLPNLMPKPCTTSPCPAQTLYSKLGGLSGDRSTAIWDLLFHASVLHVGCIVCRRCMHPCINKQPLQLPIHLQAFTSMRKHAVLASDSRSHSVSMLLELPRDFVTSQNPFRSFGKLVGPSI